MGVDWLRCAATADRRDAEEMSCVREGEGRRQSLQRKAVETSVHRQQTAADVISTVNINNSLR